MKKSKKGPGEHTAKWGAISWSEQVESYFADPGWPRLSPRALVVWAAFCNYAAPELGVVRASYRGVMKWTGHTSIETVKRAIRELIDKGYLEELDIPVVKARLYRLIDEEEGGRGLPRDADRLPAAKLFRAFERAVHSAGVEEEKAERAMRGGNLEKGPAKAHGGKG